MNEKKVQMTPEQKVKYLILNYGDKELLRYPCKNVDELYEKLVEEGMHWEGMGEIRYGEVETDIDPEYHRNFENVSVASQLPDGSWVGWTRWQGGGKHSNPEDIEWISDSYDLDVSKEEKVVTVRTFAKTIK